jgi:hypothetical protein
MVSGIVIGGSGVAALSPYSHGRLVLSWLRKYVEPTDKYALEFIDTGGRVAYFLLLVCVTQIIEWILP